MKKLFLFIIGVIVSTGAITAQDNCLEFFPSNEGSVLITKTYDGSGNILGKTTYRVLHSYDYSDGAQMQVEVVMTDKNNSVIDNGTLNASCMDGDFQLSLVNRALTPDIVNILSTDTELVGDFLDYPNTLATGFVGDRVFQMDGGNYTIQDKSDKKELTRVRVYNRQYEKNESVTVPGGTFDASKISFMFEVTKDKKTVTYKGTEWFAPGAGIVKSETYDNNGNLLNYTTLTTLTAK